MAYKSIIVGTDGSETAERAVITAAGLAAADDARLVVVTAYEESRSAAGDIAADRVPVDIRHVLTERVQAEELAERGRAAAREAGASSVTVPALPGEPGGVLPQAAKALSADSIVVGLRGLQAPAHLLPGPP